MSKFNVEVAEGNLVFGLDLNEDGEKLIEGKLAMAEAIQEAFSRSEAVPGVKLVDFGFVDGKLSLTLDSDKDGEHLLQLTVSLTEALDESGLMK